MSKLAWDETLSLGIEEIDSQHRHLFRLFDELCEAMEQGLADERMLRSHIDKLKEYAAVHFEAEEQAMKSSGYPDSVNHLDEHAELRARLAELEEMLSAKEGRLALELAIHSRNWLVSHVKETDRRYAEYRKNRSR